MKRLLILVLLAGTFSLCAQQDPLSGQYMNNLLVINPAYSGFSRDLTFAADYRKQWAGFEGSPQTMTASGHMALNKNKMGAGLIFVSDRVGSTSTTETNATYGYHMPLSSDTRLSFGLQLGVINYRTDYDELVINPNDPKFAATSGWQPNFGAGIIITNDKFFLSVSSPKMLDATTELAAQGLYRRNAYILGSYAFQLTARLRLKPYVLYRASKQSARSVDVGAQLLGDDSYTVGVFTRDLNTFGLQAQLKLDELIRLGYVFELPTNNSAGLSYTTHELQVILRFGVLTFHDIGAVRNF